MTAIVGTFYVYAYADENFALTKRNYISPADLNIADCQATEYDVLEASLGSVGWGQISGTDPCYSGDAQEPESVTTLSLVANLGGPDYAPALAWNAPSDDAPGERVVLYEFRYRQGTLDSESWATATASYDLPNPGRPGQRHSIDLPPGLEPNTEYTFGIKSIDEAGNKSPISNVVTLTTPAAESISETLDIGYTELWIGGKRVEGPIVKVFFDGVALHFNDALMTFAPIGQVWSDAKVDSLLGSVPHVRSSIDRGLSRQDAALLYLARVEALFSEAREAYLASGTDQALRVFNSSSLVESATVSKGNVKVFYKGTSQPIGIHFSSLSGSERETRSNRDRAEAVIALIKSNLESVHSELILFTNGGSMTASSGILATNSIAQIQHVISGGSPSDVPRGPLNPKSGPLREIIERRER